MFIEQQQTMSKTTVFGNHRKSKAATTDDKLQVATILLMNNKTRILKAKKMHFIL